MPGTYGGKRIYDRYFRYTDHIGRAFCNRSDCVCGLLEKQIYGDIPLERYEVRTLTCFREKLLQGAKNAGAVIRLKLHFRHLEELVRETTNS